MFATDSFTSGCGTTLLFIGVCLSVIFWRLGKMDPEGKVKNAAKEGVITIIKRYLK